MRLCRKLGITACKIDGIEFNLSPIEVKQKSNSVFIPSVFDPGNIDTSVAHKIQTDGSVHYKTQIGTPMVQPNAPDKVITDELTEEQLLFYSVSDQPEGTN